MDISFADNSNWRTNVTDVLVDGVTVGAGNWILTSGNLALDPALVTALQTVGSKIITVVATGYENAVVTQNIGVGALSLTHSSWSDDLNSAVDQVSNYTLVAKDQYGNLIQNYQFTGKLKVMNASGTTTETYVVNGNSYTAPVVSASTQVVEINNSDIGLTDATGTVVVPIDFIPGGLYDIGDGAYVEWYDETGTNLITEVPAD
ncbi:hypothetical protein B9K06_23740 [Bacillus sp. OG2]|nr:hypothetical protein B9K06_23740 [Bacillus sp. OG2]